MKKNKSGKGCGVSLLLLGLTIPSAIWSGYAITRVWTWFVVPLGVPRIGIWHAAGILVVARFLTMDSRNLTVEDGDKDSRIGWSLFVSILMPALVLGLGAIYHALGAS